MLFSIIIPVFNGERKIVNLLEKISQFDDNYIKEVFVIDSGSIDNTLSVVSAYKKKLPRLQIIKIKKNDFNHGETRNLGVKIAKGKFVCFFSDDAIPINKHVLNYYLEDFQINKNVAAVFGKHVPYEETPLIQKLEILCRWEKLDKFIDGRGLFVQNLSKPFIPYSTENKGLWYALSNTASCYRRSFLLKFPFPKIDHGEDVIIGKTIIENNLLKVYDVRCSVIHSHPNTLIQYCKKEKLEYDLYTSFLKLPKKINILCKIKKIVQMDISFIMKTYCLIELLLYYLVKIIIWVAVVIRKKNENIS